MIKDNQNIQKQVDKVANVEMIAHQRKDLIFIVRGRKWYAMVEGVYNTENWAACLMVSKFVEILDYLYTKKHFMRFDEEIPEESTITIRISNEWFQDSNILLTKEKNDFTQYEGEGYGADYTVYFIEDNKISHPMKNSWICGVGLILWGGIHPQEIYAQVL